MQHKLVIRLVLNHILAEGAADYRLWDSGLMGRVLTVTIKDAFLDELAEAAKKRYITKPTLSLQRLINLDS